MKKKSVIIFFLFETFCFAQENLVIKDVSSDFSKLALDIVKDNKTIQKIDYEYPKACFEDAVFDEKQFEVIDVNFDGFNDILVYLGSFGNQGVVYKACFLWNEKKQKFIKNNLIETIPDLKIDADEKCLYGSSRNQSAHFTYEMYSWNGKTFVLNYRIDKVSSAAQLNDVYRMNIPDGNDCGEYILEHFKLNREPYDSIFFVITNFSNGKIIISEPLIKLPDELPANFKSLINE